MVNLQILLQIIQKCQGATSNMGRVHSGLVLLILVGFLTMKPTLVFGVERDQLYRSGTFLGRGQAGLADPRDEDALFYNPANLNHTSRPESFKAVVLSPLVIFSDTANQLSNVGSDDTKKLEALRDMVGKPAFVGFSNFTGALFNDTGVGLVNSASANFYVYKNPENSGVESLNLNAKTDNGLTAGYSPTIPVEGLQLGVTAKLLKRTVYLADISIADVTAIKEFKPARYSNNGVGLGFDLGALYKLPLIPLKPQFGLTLQNLGDTSFSQAKKTGPHVTAMLQTLNAGIGIFPDLGVGKSAAFLDFRDLLNREESNIFKRVHLGGEFIYDSLVGATIGINQGFPSAGLLLTTHYFSADVGTYGEEVGVRIGERSSRRYYFRLMSTF
jgi:hypothetical protein